MELSRILFAIGSSLFIAIGILHLWVHFTQLIAEETQEKVKMAQRIVVMNKKVEVLRLWLGFSLIFGVLLLFLGIIDLLSLHLADLNSLSFILICVSNMLILLVIIYSGFKYFGKIQIYGGLLGLLLFGTTLGLLVC